MENKIDKPHDHFFRATFSKKLVAQVFLEHFLSQAIYSKLDIATLELDNGSYVDEKLEENISDLVYSCQLKKDLVNSFLIRNRKY